MVVLVVQVVVVVVVVVTRRSETSVYVSGQSTCSTPCVVAATCRPLWLRCCSTWRPQTMPSVRKWYMYKYCCLTVVSAFSALALLIGRQEEHFVCKNWLVRCWHGYLTWARYSLFVYSLADATATPELPLETADHEETVLLLVVS